MDFDLTVTLICIIFTWATGIGMFLFGWILSTWESNKEIDYLRKRNLAFESKESTRKREKPVEPGEPSVTAKPPVKKAQTSLFPTEQS